MQGNIKADLYSIAKLIGFALAIVFICRVFFFTPAIVNGESMEPTFIENERVIVSKISGIARFDLIVFKAPDKNDQYIKRVIGLPGDHVEMKDGVLFINGNAYEESYVKKSDQLPRDFTLKELTGEEKVPEDTYFVLGDNRWRSKDSRMFGFISQDSVIGEVKFRYYPLEKIGIPK